MQTWLVRRKHSSRMHTTCSLPYRGGLPDRDLLDRDPIPGQRFHPWTETPSPGQRPNPCEQNHRAVGVKILPSRNLRAVNIPFVSTAPTQTERPVNLCFVLREQRQEQLRFPAVERERSERTV